MLKMHYSRGLSVTSRTTKLEQNPTTEKMRKKSHRCLTLPPRTPSFDRYERRPITAHVSPRRPITSNLSKKRRPMASLLSSRNLGLLLDIWKESWQEKHYKRRV